jgi:hypothetical protein
MMKGGMILPEENHEANHWTSLPSGEGSSGRHGGGAAGDRAI